MRDFRDGKAMAQAVRAALAAKGLKITISDSLELIAKAFGVPDWNTLSAAIKAAEVEPDKPRSGSGPSAEHGALDGLARALGLEDWDQLRATLQTARLSPPPETPSALSLDPKPQPSRRAGFSTRLGETLHRAVGLAAARKHEHMTMEHLLLALIDDLDAADVLRGCEVDLAELKQDLTSHVDLDSDALVAGDGKVASPTAGVQRVIQRAVIHVQSAGRPEVTGANVLVAIFSEQESHAAYFLRRQKMDRFDAVNFIAHGIRKDGGRAA